MKYRDCEVQQSRDIAGGVHVGKDVTSVLVLSMMFFSSVDSKGLHVWVVRRETKCRSLSRRGVHVGKDVLLRRCGRPRHHVQHVRDDTEATIPLPHLKADRLGVNLNDGRKNGDL